MTGLNFGPLFETVTFVAVTPKVPGSIPEGPRFESRRDHDFA